MVNRWVVAVYSDDLEASKQFYMELLNLVPTFDSDWVVQMTSEGNCGLNLTLQLRRHDTIPMAFQKKPQGVSIAFVVPDIDPVFEKAKHMGLKIVRPPKDEDYGQRRFLTIDPNGMLVDVSAKCEPSAAFARKYFGLY